MVPHILQSNGTVIKMFSKDPHDLATLFPATFPFSYSKAATSPLSVSNTIGHLLALDR